MKFTLGGAKLKRQMTPIARRALGVGPAYWIRHFTVRGPGRCREVYSEFPLFLRRATRKSYRGHFLSFSLTHSPQCRLIPQSFRVDL